MGNSRDYLLCLICILLAGVIVVLLCTRGQGRYALSSGPQHCAYVLDTRTSQLWLRELGETMYLGTNENPQEREIIATPRNN